MKGRRVVVTGLGIVSCVGSEVETAWRRVVEGQSGIALLPQFQSEDYATRFGGAVREFDVARYLSPKDARKMDPFIHYAVGASMQALGDSGLMIDAGNAERVGCAIGAGIGGISGIERTCQVVAESGVRRVSPFYIPSTIINMASGQVSILLGAKGPNIAVVTACTTATHNIGLAARLIAYGDADAMLAGGAEHSTTVTSLAGFIAARALSARNDAPERASRPWDQDRDGFVMADGAGVLLLEEYEHARRRGARIYCELVGFGMSADAHHMTAPPDDGAGAAQAMRAALADAGLAPDRVQYVNAHATSTQLGDVAEVRALRSTFGAHAERLLVSSTKSVTGHLLGAAGGVEAIFTVLAIRDQLAPPTINLDQPSPECDLDFVPHQARRAPIEVAISNSFGFGGTNGSLVFQRL